MVATKFYLKYHVIGRDRLGRHIDKKFKCMEDLIDQAGDYIDVFNRQMVYKIINGFHKKECTFKILKIKEALPSKIISKRVLINPLDEPTTGLQLV